MAALDMAVETEFIPIFQRDICLIQQKRYVVSSATRFARATVVESLDREPLIVSPDIIIPLNGRPIQAKKTRSEMGSKLIFATGKHNKGPNGVYAFPNPNTRPPQLARDESVGYLLSLRAGWRDWSGGDFCESQISMVIRALELFV